MLVFIQWVGFNSKHRANKIVEVGAESSSLQGSQPKSEMCGLGKRNPSCGIYNRLSMIISTEVTLIEPGQTVE